MIFLLPILVFAFMVITGIYTIVWAIPAAAGTMFYVAAVTLVTVVIIAYLLEVRLLSTIASKWRISMVLLTTIFVAIAVALVALTIQIAPRIKDELDESHLENKFVNLLCWRMDLPLERGAFEKYVIIVPIASTFIAVFLISTGFHTLILGEEMGNEFLVAVSTCSVLGGGASGIIGRFS
ncbi:MAG: hypothetical protein GKS01_13320 [Alphaproteobacteria bacterium]|nr:hypothetical protein [Alphaproteobacteria bacterium]